MDFSGSWLKVEPELVKSVHRAVLEKWGAKALQYTDPAGAPEPRQALEELVGGLGLTGFRAFFTNGLGDSLRILAFAHLEKPCARLEDPTSQEALRAFEHCADSRLAYIQPIWRNPDGYTYSEDEIKRVAAEAPLVVYDLTYGLLSGRRVPTYGPAVAVGSLHALFPGLALGFIAAPEELYEVYLEYVQSAYLHPPTYFQYLFYTALREGAVGKVFASLKRRARAVEELLGVAATPYFAWVEARSPEIFLKHGAVPGGEFTRRRGLGRCLRLGLTSATEEEIARLSSALPPEELQGVGNCREL